MTDEEIKKIAVAYSVSRPVDEMPTNTSMARMIVADALRWLSKDYCIVLKSKVKELYTKTESDHCHVDEDNDWVVDMMLGRMEDIFGKDMFEEEKK